MKRRIDIFNRIQIEKAVLTVLHILVVVVAFYIIFHNFIGVGLVSGQSMYPTLKENSFIVMNRIMKKENELNRGDTVVFQNGNKTYLKRIIGVPGDSITFSDGNIFVNQKLLIEPYIEQGVKTYGTGDTFVVPDGRYFVLGDNRENSNDSRYFENVYAERDKILGKVFINLDCFHVNIIRNYQEKA